jgi:hypothetical protein
LKEFDRRILIDRRKKPTPALSRYTVWGRRRTFRRKADQEGGSYVDCYSPVLLFLLLLAVGLNILDTLFTMMIIDVGGWEVNPIVGSVITIYGDKFWVWKFGIVSASLILLCVHSKFRFVKAAILSTTVIYIGIVLHQLVLIIYH